MKRVEKTYKNPDFLNSKEARTLRILAEYLEPEKRFKENGIEHTVVFFGSARVRPDSRNNSVGSNFYWAAEEFAYQLALFANELEKDGKSFSICSGGGPGIMEAANRGAHRAKSINIGLNISIPLEQNPNDYISPELSFEFHYFFMRKLWFLYQAKALVVFPGGFGTMDELFETLTLLQTRKIEKSKIKILLYNKSFWNDVLNFQKLIDLELISPSDMNLFHFFSSPEEGLEILRPHLKEVIDKFNGSL
jgi:uncharacterized protein (TIGR00730 family)